MPEKEKSAGIHHIVTDMGSGGGYCSNCDHDLGGDPTKFPCECPKCHYKLYMTTVGLTSYAFGGSD